MKIKDDLDTSDFPKDNPLYSPTNKKVIGKMKFETNDKLITEFVGLRPKLYSYTVYNDKKKHVRAKGVKKSAVQHDINHQNYKQALFGTKQEEIIQHCSFNLIRSKLHKIQSIHVNKISLSAIDDKRWVCDDNINTHAIGHFRTRTIYKN
jgi:hypothetical protein